jgi:phosphatidylserine/phosphatidylglycerophosphate/cardiolipin synthase-like enzyme
VVALGLVPEGRRPSSATAWLLLIVGLLAFWLIGSPFVDRGRRRQQAAAGEVISGALTAESNDLLPVPRRRTDRLRWLAQHDRCELPQSQNERAGRTWRELVMQVSGSVVFSLDIVFATDWYIETDEILREDVRPHPYEVEPGDVVCQVVPSGPGFPDENNLRLFNSLIYSAQRRLSITSPYFVPDESLLYAITTAAQRGIDVELFVGEEGDQFMVDHAQRSYYEALLRAGVKIYLYPAPFVLHSKALLGR